MQHDKKRTPEFAAWEAEIDLAKDVDILAGVIHEIRGVHPHAGEIAVLVAHCRLRAVLLGVDIHRDIRFFIKAPEVEELDYDRR